MVGFTTFAITLTALASPVLGFASYLEKGTAFANWSPTDPNNMSPCPFVNSLANHGILPRTNITATDIQRALSAFKCDVLVQKLLSGPTAMNLGTKVNGVQEITLANLDKHGGIEHDASLTRRDTAIGDNTKLDKTLYEQLKSISTDGKYITKVELAKHRVAREADSRANNPNFTFGPKEQFLAYGESALLLLALRDNTGGIRLDWLDMVFTQEKLPFDLGWDVRTITLAELTLVAGELRGVAFGAEILAYFIMLCTILALVIVGVVSALLYASFTAGKKKPDQSTFSDWEPTDNKNLSPCPFVNSFANHKILPREKITAKDIQRALALIQCDDMVQKILSSSLVMRLGTIVNGTRTLSLKDLGFHNAIEHDASLSRCDAALGSNIRLDSELFKEFKAISTNGTHITREELAIYRQARTAHSQKNNSEFKFGLKQQLLAYVEAAVLIIALEDSTGAIRVDWLDMVFTQEKLPFELGWRLRPITLGRVLLVASELRARGLLFDLLSFMVRYSFDTVHPLPFNRTGSVQVLLEESSLSREMTKNKKQTKAPSKKKVHAKPTVKKGQPFAALNKSKDKMRSTEASTNTKAVVRLTKQQELARKQKLKEQKDFEERMNATNLKKHSAAATPSPFIMAPPTFSFPGSTPLVSSFGAPILNPLAPAKSTIDAFMQPLSEPQVNPAPAPVRVQKRVSKPTNVFEALQDEPDDVAPPMTFQMKPASFQIAPPSFQIAPPSFQVTPASIDPDI